MGTRKYSTVTVPFLDFTPPNLCTMGNGNFSKVREEEKKLEQQSNKQTTPNKPKPNQTKNRYAPHQRSLDFILKTSERFWRALSVFNFTL